MSWYRLPNGVYYNLAQARKLYVMVVHMTPPLFHVCAEDCGPFPVLLAEFVTREDAEQELARLVRGLHDHD